METMRAFIAVDVGEEVRVKLAEVQRYLGRRHAAVRWTRPETIHLTLAFLGDMPTGQLPALSTALDQRIAGLAPFGLDVGGLGYFGPARSPRVVWAGITPSPELEQLRQRIVEALRQTGTAFDEKPFAPHLTLGRVKSPKGIAGLVQRLEQDADREIGHAPIREACLFRSELGSGGARHTLLHAATLGGGS